MKIYLDMDGTIADTYAVNDWLDCLLNEDVTPYEQAKPMCSPQKLALRLRRLKERGFSIGIVTWMSKANPSKAFQMRTRRTKLKWLKENIPFEFDEFHCQKYGEDKGKWNDGEQNYLIDDVLDIPFSNGLVIPTESMYYATEGVLDALDYISILD